MTDYYIGSDNITGTERADMEAIAKKLKECGNTCEIGSVSPEQEAASYSVDKNKTFIFLVGGVAPATYWSFKCAIEAGSSPHTIFAHAGWTATDPSRPMISEEKALGYDFIPEWDSGGFADESRMKQDAGDAKTVGEYFQKYSQYITFCYSKEGPEQLAEQICNGTCASGNSGTSSGSGETSTGGASAVLIEDITFYGLIKQIIGAIDGVFIIANNMAYLLSFQDMYKYRDKFEDNIPMIEPKYIIQNSFVKQWSPDGYYNSVELTYADGVIKYQNDALVQQHGEHTFYYEFPDDDEETAKAKASALLSAHIRDYSTDIQMSIFFNENITVGSWVKLPKTVTKIDNQEDTQNKKKKKTTRKGVNITNITEELVRQSDNSYKKIQHLTDEKGKKTDIELQNKDYDLFFVQGYTCRWNKKHSLIMDIHLKYGPDTPEDPINATIAVGGSTTSTTGGTTNTGGSWGDDCFSICDICIEDCRKVLGYGGGRREDAEKYIREHEPDSKYLAGRAKQDSTYAKDVAGKTPQEAYTLFRSKFDYACYSDSCDSSYPCCEDLWTKTKAANCGDSTRMLKVLMDATGTPCYGIHVDGHYFNAVQVDGTWHTLDGTRGPTNSSCNFPDSGNYGTGSNDCGSGGC